MSMQGYKRKSYTLRWPETSIRHGLVVTMRGLSIADLNVVSGLRGQATEDLDVNVIMPVIEVLSKRMVRWNVTDENDNPVGTDVDSLADEDFGMVMDIVTAWTTAVTGVSDGLKKGSNSGNTFPEESIPMETSSQSLPN